jgi:DNA primase
MIPDEVVDQVREAADIVQLVGEYVDLKRMGADYRGACPFHQGKHRNFSVSPRRERYYCFVCHEGGDVFDFMRKRLGLDFVDAVRQVGQRFGVEVRETASNREEADARAPLWEANAAAAEWFRERLWSDPVGSDARSYLESRTISRELADQFGLGFAPRDGELLRKHLHAIGFADEVLLEAGLMHVREGESAVRPRFRGRLIFPIQDASGRYVGFGGRVIGPGEPKYLNSPESRVYNKSRLLYGLHWAKGAIRREKRVLLVEGYIDAMRIAEAGITNVVAPLGTALTEEQAKLLRRYTSTAYLLYDGDQAGLKATFRAGDVLLREGAAVMVISLPDGEDPDSFALAHGAAGLSQQMTGAVDLLERKIQVLSRAGYFADLHRKRQALDKLIPTIRATADPLTRELYMSRVAEAVEVGRQHLQREVDEGSGGSRDRGGRRPSTGAEAAPPHGDGGAPSGGASRIEQSRYDRSLAAQGSERELIRALLIQPERLAQVVERVSQEEFLHPVYRRIFIAVRDNGGEHNLSSVIEAMDEQAAAVASRLVEEGNAMTLDLSRTVNDAIARLGARKVDHEMWEIDLVLPLAAAEEKDSLLQRKMALFSQKRAVSGGAWTTFGRPRT